MGQAIISRDYQLLNQDCDIVIQQRPETAKQLPLLFARHLLTVSEIKLDMDFVIYINYL